LLVRAAGFGRSHLPHRSRGGLMAGSNQQKPKPTRPT
jgi:hypothetical protein